MVKDQSIFQFLLWTGLRTLTHSQPWRCPLSIKSTLTSLSNSKQDWFLKQGVKQIHCHHFSASSFPGCTMLLRPGFHWQSHLCLLRKTQSLTPPVSITWLCLQSPLHCFTNGNSVYLLETWSVRLRAEHTVTAHGWQSVCLIGVMLGEGKLCLVAFPPHKCPECEPAWDRCWPWTLSRSQAHSCCVIREIHHVLDTTGVS